MYQFNFDKNTKIRLKCLLLQQEMINSNRKNYGFVKVAAAVPRVKVADCKFNSERLEGLITIAEGKGVQILTFPEMCITGYTCGDLFAPATFA